MAEIWQGKELEGETADKFEMLVERGYSVRAETNNGNIRIVLTRPPKGAKAAKLRELAHNRAERDRK